MRPQVAIVVVSYNTRSLLLSCLASVIESKKSTSIELMVVDNASGDGSYEAAREACPEAVIIRNSTNLGFGAAANQAITQTSAPFILLLNSDARLTPEAFSALVDLLGSNSRCGAAGCRLINAQGEEMTSTRNFLTPFNQALELLSFTKRTHRLRPDANLTDCSVDWIEAACLLVRRAALDEVGLFDERFFMYSEDEDLCLRLRNRGWTICFTGRGTAIHHGAQSSANRRLEMLCQLYSSQMLFLAKHRGRASVSLYKFAMKTALILKRLLPGGKARREELTERLVAFRRAEGKLRIKN
ncbi:MAG TPA: glycosyltransferase family 2 protein [Blastocatellia bacterium]|nr:glycosyltransferase family 2 protein [Blastocatellia bacterium]